MICAKCKSDGIENEVLGKKFWYCRTCKDEIKLDEVKADSSPGAWKSFGLSDEELSELLSGLSSF